MADIDKEVEKIEQGDAWNETDAVKPVEVKKPLDKVSLRVSTPVF